jgi:hypothetical protein
MQSQKTQSRNSNQFVIISNLWEYYLSSHVIGGSEISIPFEEVVMPSPDIFY